MAEIDSSDKAPAAITGRSILVGAALSLIIAVGIPYGSMVVQGSRLGLSSATPAAFFLLFVLLLTVQVALGACKRTYAFSRGELVTIFVMMAVATAIPTRGVVGMLLPMITGAFYYATPENQWAELVHPFLSDWMVVVRPASRQGVLRGHGWLFGHPLAGLVSTARALVGILRRILCGDHCRHIHPAPPMGRKRALGLSPRPSSPSHGRRRGRWRVAPPQALVPQSHLLVRPAADLLHQQRQCPAPVLQLHRPYRPPDQYRTIQPHRHSQYPHQLSDVWLCVLPQHQHRLQPVFFYLLHVVQESLFSYVGIFSPEELGPWTGSGPVGAIMGHQMMGALIVLVCYGLWTARPHLKNVFRKALWGDERIDDSEEILSYRVSVYLLVGGISLMGYWLWKTGIPAWIVPFFLFSSLVIFIGLARVIAETGMPTVTPEMVPAGFVVSGVGVPALGAAGMVAAGYTFAWAGDLLVFMTAPLANGLRLGSELKSRRRFLFWAIVAAMLISLVAACWFMLHLAYRDGAVNLHPQYFTGFATYPSDFAAQKLANPTGPSLAGWLWTGFGALIMGGLMAARHFFVWWPFHPLGFAVSTGWVMNSIWFSIFLAWLIKIIVLKYGGPRTYFLTRPFFIGIVLGQFVAAGLWLVVDGFTGMVGNRTPVY